MLGFPRTLSRACLVAAVAACGPLNNVASDASDEHSITGSSPDGGGGEAGNDAALGLSTSLRVAQLSSSLGSVDLCYRALAAQTFTGPIFATPMTTMEAGAPGSDAATSDAGIADAGSPSPDAEPATDATSSEGAAPPDAAPSDAGADATGRADATLLDANPVDAASVADGAPEDAAIDTGIPDAERAEVSVSDASTDGAMGARDSGSGAGLAFLDVSNYLTIQGAGTFELIIVPAGQGGCTGPLIDQKVTLDDGKHSTVVIFGLDDVETGPAALSLLALTDDATTVAASARTRLFDAALLSPPSGSPEPLLVSVEASGAIEDLAIVTPGAAPSPSASPPTADALGYGTEAPVVGPAQLRLQPDTDGGLDAGTVLWQSAPGDLHLDPGSIHTGFIVQDSRGELGALWCDDTSVGSALAACTLLAR